MRLLDRYLLREFLVPLAFCLSGFLIFWVAFDLFSELHSLQDKHLLAQDIAEYYLFRIPDFLPIALPVALLLAMLYALTTHSRYNELTAMRAAGVSLWRLCMPYMAVGFISTVGLFALNEFCAPKTADIAEEILGRRATNRPDAESRDEIRNPPLIVNTRERRFWEIGIYNELTGEMINPHVKWHLPDDSWRSIDADRAIRTNGVWTFYGNVTETIESNSLPRKVSKGKSLAMPEFTETPAEMTSQINILERFRRQTRTRRADVPIKEILDYLRLVPNPEMWSWLVTKLQGRFAGPCTCLVVVLIAVPFAGGSGRRNVFVGVAASITIFFLYYILQQVGFALGEAGRLPPWVAAWLPNLTFGIAGLWMMIRIR
jgi:lipopolysaccharide export system permease protein